MSEIRVLVLGALGMLGHRLVLSLPEFGYRVIGTARRAPLLRRRRRFANPAGQLLELDAMDRSELEEVLERAQPQAVVNCIGWVRQRGVMGRYAEAVHVNAVFPHWLDEACGRRGIGLVHISTDCASDADWYGISKLQGEGLQHGLVVRTSFIGHELQRRLGLLEWLLRQQGVVNGHAGIRWSGLTTGEMAGVIGRYLIPGLRLLRPGPWNISGPEITKCELLELINREYGLGLEVRPVPEPVADRRLDGRPFEEATGYRAPSWKEMLEQMHRERPVQIERVAA